MVGNEMDTHTHREQTDGFTRINTRWVVLGGAIATASILLLLLISLVTDYTTSKRQLARKIKPVEIAPGAALEITYPEYLLLGANPAALVVGLKVKDAAVFTPPLTVTIETPPSITIDGAAQQRWVFERGNGLPATFLLENTAVLPLRQRENITLTYALTTTNTTLLTIDVEAPRTAVWRRFIVSTVNEKSPLLLTITILISIAGLVVQQLHKQEERKEREIDIAIKRLDLEEKEYQRASKRRQLAAENIPTLRKQFTLSNVSGIQQAWSQIDSSLLSTVSPPPQNEWLLALVKLSLEGTIPDEQAYGMWKQWPLESVGALLAAQNHVLARPQDFQHIFRQIPLNEVKDLKVRDRYIQLWHQIDPIPLQNWPQEITVKTDALRESLLPQTNLRHILQRDPLQYALAEHEENSLLVDDGFWSEHPTYGEVATATSLQLVYGPGGCGRTALAINLCYHESRLSRFFWHYKPVYVGLNNIPSLSRDLTSQLLQYVVIKPTLLLPVQENQRQLLAQVLITAWGRQYILAQLDSAKSNKRWARQAITEGQKRAWQQVGDTQLALLLQAVEVVTEGPVLSEHQWAKSLLGCFDALGFHGVRLVLDCAPGTIDDITTLLPTLQEWQQSGLITTVFIPGDGTNIPVELKVSLNWSKKQLEELFAHRLLRLADCHNPTMPFQDKSVYNRFVEFAASDKTVPLPPTPRKLVQMWQAILEKIGEQKESIDMETLDAVRSSMQRWVEEASSNASLQEIDLSRLRNLMDETFSDEDLRDLCLDLRVDYDNLPARAKRGKIQELILLLQKQGRLPELPERCRQLRPRIAW
jgi:hypothetical protein